MSRRIPIVLSLLAAVLWLAAAAGHATAQVRPVEPYHAVVTVNGAAMRSGDMADYYKVAELRQGQVVRVDAEGNGWARVTYPPGVTAFVDAREAQADGQTARLSRRSALKARSMVAGWGASWQRLMPEGSELEPGATLRIVTPVTNRDGAVVGYEIEAPAGARGFIASNQIRRATEDEVRRHEAALAAGTTPEPTPSPEPAPTPPQDDPAPAAPAPAPRAEETRPDDPLPPSEPTAEPEPPVQDRPVGAIEALEAAFEAMRTQNPDTAELDELAAEIRRTIGALDDSPLSHGLRARLELRLQMLELWISLRETRAKLARSRSEVETGSTRLEERLAALERTRGYEFIGRLVPSTVYDGERLPLMYRVVSVGGASPRTIGYVRPDDRFDLGPKLGRVVGVVGEAGMDHALGLKIVSPQRVDVLRPEDGVPIDTRDAQVPVGD